MDSMPERPGHCSCLLKVIAQRNLLPIPTLNCKVYSLKILFKGSFWATILIIWFLTEKILILQVLFLELKLPPNGEMKMQSSKKTLGSTRRGTESNHKLRVGRRFSTSKVLRGTHGAESKLLAFDAMKKVLMASRTTQPTLAYPDGSQQTGGVQSPVMSVETVQHGVWLSELTPADTVYCCPVCLGF